MTAMRGGSTAGGALLDAARGVAARESAGHEMCMHRWSARPVGRDADGDACAVGVCVLDDILSEVLSSERDRHATVLVACDCEVCILRCAQQAH